VPKDDSILLLVSPATMPRFGAVWPDLSEIHRPWTTSRNCRTRTACLNSGHHPTTVLAGNPMIISEMDHCWLSDFRNSECDGFDMLLPEIQVKPG
jgi:hypothetical protein